MSERPTALRNGAKKSPKVKKTIDTVGFGCPDITDPHHFTVTVPRGRTKPVVVTEHFGIAGEAQGMPEKLDRVLLSYDKWKAIAEDLQAHFNERLRELGHKTSRWQTGTNKVDRLLGKELTLLAWAIEHADLDLVSVAVKNWLGLKREERWWLFTMTAAATGRAGDGQKGWRKGIRYCLTENPTEAPPLRKADVIDDSIYELPLFELDA